MQTKTKILAKQSLIILSIIIICLLAQFIPAEDYLFFFVDDYEPLFVVGVSLLLLFTPLTFLYYLFLKKKIDLSILNLFFRLAAYTTGISFLILFLFEFWQIFYINDYADSSFLNRLWMSISFRFSSVYLSTGEYFSIWQEFKETLYLLPYLIPSVLFFWAIKTNKKLNKE